jgi:hypothetical protein
LREILEVVPFPVYLLREVPDMMEWLLLVALGVHFRFLHYSFLRVRKPDVTPRFHFRFIDPILDMESLLPLSVRYRIARQSDADFRRENYFANYPY